MQCSQGHDNTEGQAFCGTCGEPLGDAASGYSVTDDDLSVSDLTSDGFFMAMSVISLGCVVMFIAALAGAGQTNTPDRLDTFAYLSAVGAATWLIAALVAWGLAAWRVNILRGG